MGDSGGSTSSMAYIGVQATVKRIMDHAGAGQMGLAFIPETPATVLSKF